MMTIADDTSADTRLHAAGRKGESEMGGHVAVLGLDTQLSIRWMTRAIRTQFGMQASSVGQPLSSVSHHFAYPHLLADAKATLHTGQPKVQSFMQDDTRWMVELNPCYGEDNSIDGLVLSFWEDLAFRRAREVVETIDQERRRLGQELHEALASQLAGTSMVIHALESKVDAAPRGLADEFRQVGRYVHAASKQASNLSHLLMPMDVEGEDMEASLRALAERMAKVWPHVSFAFDGLGKTPQQKIPPLRGDVASHLYRIAVEVIWSATKHRKVSRIQIGVLLHEDHIRLTVQDDHGSEPVDASPAGQRMVQLITRRAALIGASIEVNTTNGTGTQVACHVPLKKARHDAAR